MGSKKKKQNRCRDQRQAACHRVSFWAFQGLGRALVVDSRRCAGAAGRVLQVAAPLPEEASCVPGSSVANLTPSAWASARALGSVPLAHVSVVLPVPRRVLVTQLGIGRRDASPSFCVVRIAPAVWGLLGPYTQARRISPGAGKSAVRVQRPVLSPLEVG